MLVFSACTGTRQLAEDEYLARDGKVRIEEKERIKEFADIRFEINKMAQVKQNNKLLWMRPRLSIHNAFKEPNKEKGFKFWMKYKLGTPPRIYSEQQTQRVVASINDYLFNNSYFNAIVEYDVIESRNQKKTVYHIRTGSSFRIGDVGYEMSQTSLDQEIHENREGTKLIGGEPYKLNNLIEERKRLAFSLMNNGHYYFRPDYMEFRADTSNHQSQIDLSLMLKPTTPGNAFNQYKINKVVIRDNLPENAIPTDTITENRFSYLTSSTYIKPRVVANTIHLSPDSLYNRDLHLKTLNHIRSLQVYKFVSITYTQDDSVTDRLNANVALYPFEKMSFGGELNANIKSNNFAGPGILFSFTNRNTFKSAELLNISFGGRFETQLTGEFKGNTSYEVRLDGALQLPRLYPFRSKRIQRENIPATIVNLGGGLQERVGWYQMININSTLRYSWRTSEKMSQRFSPLDINLSNLLNTTDTFEIYLENNPSVRRSFEEQFIIGMNYNFYYSASTDRLNTPFFFGFTFDPSGSLLGGVTQLVRGSSPTNDNPYRILGLPYAQYVRSIFDIRKTFFLWPNHALASRIYIGAGIPYGNSLVMPYIKQFYVGGTNSLRGFQARSVGPGSYYTPSDSSTFIDQAGDIKLEMNVEYRFPVWGILHSALYLDAGNIWLVNEDINRKGGEFVPNEVFNQLAVSTGIGLRVKLDPIIIRFDWAWPIRYPYQIEESNWVIDQVDFSNYEWRKRNLILNISLGYPF